MGSLSAGELDREVTIQELTVSEGTSGYPVETWSALGDAIYMQMMPVSGRERFHAGELSAPMETRWQCQYDDRLDPDLVNVQKNRRLVYAGRSYDIVDARQIGRQDGIELRTLVKGDTEPS